MADVRLAVGRRRAVEEGEGFRRAVAGVKALLDDTVFLPEPQRFLFPGDDVHIRRCFPIHVHPSCFRIEKSPPALGRTYIRGTTQVGGRRSARLFHPLSQMTRPPFGRRLQSDSMLRRLPEFQHFPRLSEKR